MAGAGSRAPSAGTVTPVVRVPGGDARSRSASSVPSAAGVGQPVAVAVTTTTTPTPSQGAAPTQPAEAVEPVATARLNGPAVGGVVAPANAPWATVVRPTRRLSSDSEVLKEKLERIQQEVRNVALMQRRNEELEQTRQRVSKMETSLQCQQKETQEAKEQREELYQRLAEKNRLFQEVEQRFQEATGEVARTKKELSQAVHEFNSAIASKERLEEEQRTSRCQLERSAQLERRCEELERSEQNLLDQVQHIESQRHALEAQVAEAVHSCEELGGRLGTATEAARRLEGEKRLLESELERARQMHGDSQQESRDLHCRNALLEDQVRQLQDQKQQMAQQQKEKQDDVHQWYQKCIDDAERGTAAVQHQNQELRRDLWELSAQVRQERNVAVCCTPGEYLKLMKANEGESLAVEHGRLQKQLVKTQCDLELCVRKLDEQEKIIRSFQSAANR